jgi:putative endonuclease
MCTVTGTVGSNPTLSAFTLRSFSEGGHYSEQLMFYVYILKCSDNTFYTGCTENLEERKLRHDKGYVDSTKNKLPVQLICFTAFEDRYKAFQFESYLKSGSGIAFRNKHFI